MKLHRLTYLNEKKKNFFMKNWDKKRAEMDLTSLMFVLIFCLSN